MRYHLKLGLFFSFFWDVSLGVIKVSENPLVIICFVISFVSSLYLTHVTCATWCCSLLGATGFDTKLFVTIPRIVTTFLLSSQLSSQFLSSSRISQSSLLRWSDKFGGWRKKIDITDFAHLTSLCIVRTVRSVFDQRLEKSWSCFWISISFRQILMLSQN